MKVAMVAAGFSAEEADQLRRAMAAWRKSDKITAFYDKIISGMIKNGYDRDFAERTFNQIRGFGEYGFPESHAASFALLVYVSSWIKFHHPDVFCVALLNSQPMGFYAPAQIVRDAIDHDVKCVHPDVNFSQWDCTLEIPRMLSRVTSTRRDVRLGLRMIKGMRLPLCNRLVSIRESCDRFISIDHLHRASGLPRSMLMHLAEADTFRSVGLSRRSALWKVLQIEQSNVISPNFLCGAEEPDNCSANMLPTMSRGEEVLTDYATVGLSLKAHPISLIRDVLNRQKILSAAKAVARPHRSQVTVCGMVLIRQRPGTASGVVFVTLEDETGIVNLIVRPRLFDLFRDAARHASILECSGRVERNEKVVHIMAERMSDRSELISKVSFRSRDFH
jgi:error-prone DNA polymerase